LIFNLTGCKSPVITEVPVKETQHIVEKLVPVFIPQDSALFDAFLACDSLNKVYVREIKETKTNHINTEYQLSDNRLVYKTTVKYDTIYIPQKETERFIEIPVKVEVEKKVNELTRWQVFLIWMGRGLIIILLIIIFYRIIKWRAPNF